MPEKDDLDLLLDSALSTYADPGPDSGLEQRVLAAVAAARVEQGATAKPRRSWLPWAIALPVAAGLLILWLAIPKVVHSPVTPPRTADNNKPVNAPFVSPPANPSQKLGHHSHPSGPAIHPAPPPQVAHAAPSPKLDVFPTPAPLSPEERALVTVADAGPAAPRQALIEAQQQPDAPLSVAALNIPPLAQPDEGKN